MENRHRINWSLTLFYLAVLLLFGCGEQNSSSTASRADTPEKQIATAAINTVPAEDPASGKEKALTFDTQILTVGETPVYLPEFLFWLKYISSYYKTSNSLEKITDWSVKQNGMSLSEFFLTTAVGYAAKDRAIEAKAKELGIALSPENLAEIQKKREDNIKIYGSELEYLRIVASMYVSEDVFTYLSKIDYLGNYLFCTLYGEKGEKCTDQEVSNFIRKEGYLNAKYIFLSNTDADGKALSSEKVTENHKRMEDILAQLKESSTPLPLFDTLMNEVGEDADVKSHPDGLLFISGALGEEFQTAFSKLKENEYSGVVTAPKGFYLILKMPITPDMAADSSGGTLRYHTAYDYLFKNQVEAWGKEIKVAYEKGYDSLIVENLIE
jgi:hypothetical protein